ncbi:Serine protease SPPA, chloroplastic [Glycine max]|nr:Serine protease SPPA, chloroplastic [Glycine max]
MRQTHGNMSRTRIAIQRFRHTYTALSSSAALTRSQFQCSQQHLTRAPLLFHAPRHYSSSPKQDYPTGDFDFKPITGWKKFTVNLKMLTAFPWERLRYGTLLTIKLRGQISDQLNSRFSPGLSLPQICDNFFKATYDPRISGIYLHIDILNCGWAKVEEIRRHILNFRKSENLGIEPEVERIGKYKSVGDQLTRKTMSEDHHEMLTALLDNIYTNWLDKVSSARGKKREDIENFINKGVYQVERLKEEGFLTDIIYDDEKILWSGKELIAIIRASGSIRRIESSLSTRSSGIIGEKLIEKIRKVRESNKYKAAIIRIDSPGGDALASDLMWREIRLLAASKPVIASMSDVAASGGYYMAMGAGVIVAESLTLTGSIGVVTGKFNLGKLYEKIGFNKEIISRGRYAELRAAEQRSLRPDEAELFSKSAQHAYKQFRDKAALSRSMTVDKMEEVAQGRVWTGKDAASHGLVDAIGGLSRAVAIAKLKANIPLDRQVTVLELSRPSPSLPEILRGLGNSLVGVDRTFNELLQDLTFSHEVQARMDGIMFEKLEGYPYANPILALIKDYLSSL